MASVCFWKRSWSFCRNGFFHLRREQVSEMGFHGKARFQGAECCVGLNLGCICTLMRVRGFKLSPSIMSTAASCLYEEICSFRAFALPYRQGTHSLEEFTQKLFRASKGREMAGLFDQNKFLVRSLKLVEVLFRLHGRRDRVGIALEDKEWHFKAHTELAEIKSHEFVKQLLGRKIHPFKDVHDITNGVVG